MRIFRDINLVWDEKPVNIKGDDNIMTLIRKIEEIATVSELQLYLASGGMSLSMLCEIYAVILNHGGVEVSVSEVYGVFAVVSTDKNVMQEAIASVILMCLPEKVLKDAESDYSEDKNPKNSPKPTSKRKSKKPKTRALQ